MKIAANHERSDEPAARVLHFAYELIMSWPEPDEVEERRPEDEDGENGSGEKSGGRARG